MFLPSFYDATFTSTLKKDGEVSRNLSGAMFLGAMCAIVHILNDEIESVWYGDTTAPALLPQRVSF